MATSDRKRREVEEREARILDVGRELLLERGYLGLTMDRVAQQIDYSKGTVYQHFASKEHLLAALEVQTMSQRIAMFQRAATFRGSSRERMAAIGMAEELFVQLNPAHFRCCQIIHAGDGKLSEEHLAGVRASEDQCRSVLEGVIRDAVASADLELDDPARGTEMTLGLWSLYVGLFTLMSWSVQFEHMGIPDPIENNRRVAYRLLDGYGWKPLTDDWDWDATHQRILSEVFPEEARQLAAR